MINRWMGLADWLTDCLHLYLFCWPVDRRRDRPWWTDKWTDCLSDWPIDWSGLETEWRTWLNHNLLMCWLLAWNFLWFYYCANQKNVNTLIFLCQKLIYFLPVFILLLFSQSFSAKIKCKFYSFCSLIISKLNKSVHAFFNSHSNYIKNSY